MIKVYFETNGYAELVAIFNSEELYGSCYEVLKEQAQKEGFLYVTESVEETDINSLNRVGMKNLEDYLETHFDIVAQITLWEESSNEGTLISKAREEKGQGGIYELAKEWTDEFQERYKDIVWGIDAEYYDTMEEFLNVKNQE